MRSVHYPDDTALVDSMTKKKEWAEYKSTLLDKVPKNRWPKQITENDAFVV